MICNLHEYKKLPWATFTKTDTKTPIHANDLCNSTRNDTSPWRQHCDFLTTENSCGGWCCLISTGFTLLLSSAAAASTSYRGQLWFLTTDDLKCHFLIRRHSMHLTLDSSRTRAHEHKRINVQCTVHKPHDPSPFGWKEFHLQDLWTWVI